MSKARENQELGLKEINELSEVSIENYDKESTIFIFDDESKLYVDTFNTVVVYDDITLQEIVAKIKQENINLSLQYDDEGTISEEDSNELLLNILKDYELEDDYGVLSDAFGTSGADTIREAEAGSYPDLSASPDKKFYLIETNSVIGIEWITNIDEATIVRTLQNRSLRFITNEYATIHGINPGEARDMVSNELLEDAEYAKEYVENWINLDELEDGVYFDDYSDEFFTKDDILGWEDEECIYFHDGSNFKMIKILETKNVPVEHIESNNYDTGTIETYSIGTNIIKVDCSMYQGCMDTVVEGIEYV